MDKKKNYRRVRGRYFIMTFRQRIRFPIMFEEPIPMSSVLTVLVPTRLRLFPRLIGLLYRHLFLLITITRMLTCTGRTLRRRTTFRRISTIVFLSREFRLTNETMRPVKPCTIRTINTFRMVNGLNRTLRTFFPKSRTTFSTCRRSNCAGSTTTNNSGVLILFKVVPVRISTFTYRSKNQFHAIPRMIRVCLLSMVGRFIVQDR